MSMDSSGKIIFAKHSDILQANLKNLGGDSDCKDGEILPVAVKEMGSCEIYPQALSHNPNGRYIELAYLYCCCFCYVVILHCFLRQNVCYVIISNMV